MAHLFSLLFAAHLAAAAAAETALVEKGRQVFQNNCVACHGINGDGRGPASAAISGAKPRNFIEGNYKYGSTPEEIFQTITKGVKGTAMPSWTDLPEADRRAVIAYILSLKKP